MPGRDPLSIEHEESPLLARLGIDGDSALVAALKSDRAIVRREALFALARERVRMEAEPRLREAIPLLADPDAEVRAFACWALGHAREPDARAPLERLAADEKEPARVHAEARAALAILRASR
jgi:HEAT repeat protein